MKETKGDLVEAESIDKEKKNNERGSVKDENIILVGSKRKLPQRPLRFMQNIQM